MSLDADIIDISSNGNRNSPIDLQINDISSTPKSVNFGPGIELLMNDKKISEGKNSSTDLNLGELDALEDELNDIENPKNNLREAQSSMFSINIADNKKIDTESNEPEEIKISGGSSIPGIAKASSEQKKESEKTWDGYSTFNNIPLNANANPEPKLTPEELLRQKFKYLRKLEDLEKKGINLTKTYTMDSSLSEMQGEYETLIAEKEKSNSVKFQGRMLMAAITGLEFLNNRFDPFDLKLDGWAEQVNENVDDYDEIFGELHEKYRSKAKMAPELKLLFQLGGGAVMLHMTNTMFKSAMPGMDDIMKQNPELMQQFQQAAVNSMSQNNPGFGNFMGNMMEEQIPTHSGPPPPPMKTQVKKSTFSEPRQMRPDLEAARGGINLNDNFGNPNQAEKSMRPEMKGPSDISDLLSGLRTTTVEETKPEVKPVKPVKPVKSGMTSANNSSTISLQELKDMQLDGVLPKKSKRRNKSDKNTISLDF